VQVGNGGSGKERSASAHAEAPDTKYCDEDNHLEFYLFVCFLWQIVRER